MSNCDLPKNSELIKSLSMLVSYLGIGIISYLGIIFAIFVVAFNLHFLWIIAAILLMQYANQTIKCGKYMVESILGEDRNEAMAKSNKWANFWYYACLIVCIFAVFFDDKVVVEIGVDKVETSIVERI